MYAFSARAVRKKFICSFSRNAHAQSSFRVAHAQIEKITTDFGRIGACFYLSVIQLYDVKSAVTELLIGVSTQNRL